ncbi:MAG: hypothetical protein WAS24_09615 [Thermoplasmata archaeon]
MTETPEETPYRQVGFPGSYPNWKSFLGVLPACLLFSLAYAGFFNHAWYGDYTSLGYIWLICGVALVAASIGGFRGVEVLEKSTETSLIMFWWACADALLGLAFLAGRHLPHNAWLGLALAFITVLLMHLGAIFVVWDTLTEVFGVFAKIMTAAMGVVSLVAAGVLAFELATTIVAT